MSEVQRKLASIRIISEINPIPGADAIEVATVDGWEVVVKKGEFAVGDKAVYFEIDSLLPIRPEFEFLHKSCYRKTDQQEGYRLRTIKLRGQISQGLLIPISLVTGAENRPEGEDLTEELGIQKWIPNIPVQLAADVEGPFPTTLFPKTDEERIQNLTRPFELWKHLHEFVITEKLDGSSMSCYLFDGKFGICSRNWELKKSTDNLYWKVAIELGIEDRLVTAGIDVAIQGELIGPGIQGNKYRLPTHDFRVFSGYLIDDMRYMTHEELMYYCDMVLLRTVPTLEIRRFNQMTIKDVVQYAEGKSQLENTEREGIVCRALTDSHISFKAISNKFLAAEKD